MKRTLTALAVAAAVLATPFVAAAHNAGHFILPDGTCHEIGSFKHGPLVGPDKTRLDLVPQTPSPPFDEFGVSFVGFFQRNDIRPGPCPAGPPSSTTTASADTAVKASSDATTAATAQQPANARKPEKK
jgi:hypothetical protein